MGLPPALFGFLRDLHEHNDTAWFHAHRDRYEHDVRAPVLSWLDRIQARLGRIAPVEVIATRTQGSLAPQHRDRRFGPDRPPYWEQVLLRFPWEGPGPARFRPALGLRLDATGATVTGGIRDPGREVLSDIRRRIVDEPAAWTRVRRAIDLGGGRTLQRVPAGLDPGHRFADDLRRKDLVASVRLDAADVKSPAWDDVFLTACREVAPLPRFIAKALQS